MLKTLWKAASRLVKPRTVQERDFRLTAVEGHPGKFEVRTFINGKPVGGSFYVLCSPKEFAYQKPGY